MRILQSAGASAPHQQWLLRVGEGRLEEASGLHPLAVPLPRHLCVDPEETIQEFVDWVYPAIREHMLLVTPPPPTHGSVIVPS